MPAFCKENLAEVSFKVEIIKAAANRSGQRMYTPTPVNLINSLEALSPARLSSYRHFFSPASDQELYGIYCWNEVLSTNFMRLIGNVEITLRNKFHYYLSQHVSRVQGAAYVGTPDSNDWYNHVGLRGKSLKKVQDLTHDSRFNPRTNQRVWTPKAVMPTANQVVSNMTLGFWAPLLDLQLPWTALIPQIFPKHRYASNANHWKSSTNVGQVYERLNRVRDIRNRVAHFEPLWKIRDIDEEVRNIRGVTPRVEFIAPTNEVEALDRLQMFYDRTVQLLHWLSPDRALDHRGTELHLKTCFLMTQKGLDRYKRGETTQSYRTSSLTKSWGAKLMVKDRRPMELMHKGQVIGIFYPTP